MSTVWSAGLGNAYSRGPAEAYPAAQIAAVHEAWTTYERGWVPHWANISASPASTNGFISNSFARVATDGVPDSGQQLFAFCRASDWSGGDADGNAIMGQHDAWELSRTPSGLRIWFDTTVYRPGVATETLDVTIPWATVDIADGAWVGFHVYVSGTDVAILVTTFWPFFTHFKLNDPIWSHSASGSLESVFSSDYDRNTIYGRPVTGSGTAAGFDGDMTFPNIGEMTDPSQRIFDNATNDYTELGSAVTVSQADQGFWFKIYFPDQIPLPDLPIDGNWGITSSFSPAPSWYLDYTYDAAEDPSPAIWFDGTEWAVGDTVTATWTEVEPIVAPAASRPMYALLYDWINYRANTVFDPITGYEDGYYLDYENGLGLLPLAPGTWSFDSNMFVNPFTQFLSPEAGGVIDLNAMRPLGWKVGMI